MGAIDNLLDPIPIPRMVRVVQSFERPVIRDLESEFEKQLDAKNVASLIRKGQRIAITAGSRGIHDLPRVLGMLVRVVKQRGGEPFLVPAMGSHGGATAEGQAAMLRSMGIHEEAVGAPVRATMETVKIGESDKGIPVYMDRYAHEADGVIIVNQIKPHVSFRGPYESGLMKMMVIGLGKQKGAAICHDLGFGRMAENISDLGRRVLEKGKVLFGLAMLENAHHETCRLEILKGNEIEKREPALLEEARALSPKIFLDRLDVLIIEEMGKDISGTGFDTNTVGRYHSPYASGGPVITRIAVLDLTDRSHGNANGLGIADFTTRRLFDKLDFEQTYPNSLTTTVPLSVKIPMVLKNDRQAIRAAIKTCNRWHKNRVRMVKIRNTNELNRIEASESLLEEIREHGSLKTDAIPYGLTFDEEGNLQKSPISSRVIVHR